jgi:preprotein translocase SecE subunit
MLNSKLKRISLALVLAVVLTLSLFTLSAFALEDAGAAPDGEQGIVLDVSAPAESDTAAADTEKVEAPESDSESAVDTTGEAKDEHEGHDHGDEKTEEKKGFTVGSIISLAALGVVIILVVVYCLTHKEKVAKLFRGLKSEMKKIVWTPWNQVRKNTFVVLVVLISAAILIGLLDFLFSKGIFTLGKLF